MTSLRVFLVFLGLGVFGTLSAVVPIEKITYKRPGSLQPSGSGKLGIYNGTSTTIEKHPYLAGVLYLDDFICAATIIADRWVILSADCGSGYIVDDASKVDVEDLNVVVGSNDGSSGEKYAVEEVVVHPNYGQSINYLDYNFALFKVKDKFKWSSTVKKASLPKKNAKLGSEIVVAGWGDTSSNGGLKEGNMEVISNKKCEKLYEDLGFTFTARLGCTYNKGKTTLCFRDWSDPIVEKGVIYQLFVAIATDGLCSSSAMPAINADVFSVKQWIKNTTKIKEDDEEEKEEE